MVLHPLSETVTKTDVEDTFGPLFQSPNLCAWTRKKKSVRKYF